MNRRKILLGGVAAVAAPVIGKFNIARAAGAPDASRLTADLTPLGAERAASASGHVPAWTGGVNTPPAGWDPSGYPPDLFGDEKPLFSVTSANVAQYKDMLSDGQVEMINRFGSAGYRLDVFPTHRTACAPQWVYDNTAKNVTRAQAVPEGLKYGFTGAFCGPPFPILSDDPNIAGAQAIWNHQTRWSGQYINQIQVSWVVGNGVRSLTEGERTYTRYQYYDKTATPDTFGKYYLQYYLSYVAPPNQVGGLFIANFAICNLSSPNTAFEYLVGQGRIRQAPSVDYDIPATQYADAANYDEVQLFQGAMDRYDWKLVGKKEMIIPYNQHKLLFAPVNDAMGLQFPNPDLVRYEIHRCWIVEADLAPGKRMTEPKRRFYLDEDTWFCMMSDAYDSQGNYWKLGHNYNVVQPNLPGTVWVGSMIYNFQSADYLMQLPCYGETGALASGPIDFGPHPASLWNPQAMANSGGL